MTLLKRLTMILRDGCVEKVFYPVFPPDLNAKEVIDWLDNHPPMQRICVFLGSNRGRAEVYADSAVEFAKELVKRGIGLVYGGSGIGLMGIVADAVLEGGGEAIGVIPRELIDQKLGHGGLSELHVVETMHERKALMGELCDGFVALPGGLGTFEELLEAMTWAQLGLHAKPCGLINVGGYFDRMLSFLDHAVAEGFVAPESRIMLTVAETPAELLDRIAVGPPFGSGPRLSD